MSAREFVATPRHLAFISDTAHRSISGNQGSLLGGSPEIRLLALWAAELGEHPILEAPMNAKVFMNKLKPSIPYGHKYKG